MVSFRHYVLVSTLLTLSSLSYAFHTRKHFYNAAIYMTTNKLNIVVLVNLCFLLLCILGKSIKRVFLGTLQRDEIEELVQSSKYAITETMLALTIFREELNLRLLMLFTALLFIKIFHWLASMRVESLARSEHIGRLQHIRLIALLAFLAIIDWSFVIAIGIALMQSRTASVLLLFGFEYLILSVFLASTWFKYVLLVLDARWEAQGQHWAAKTTWMFYLEFCADLIRLFLYLLFFLIVCTYYGLPLHLIRELGITFVNLRDRIIKFIHFRKLTRNMNERFADATAEELAQGDRTCIVCREDMEVGTAKKLPCAHMFHKVCLKQWLERSQSCPTCRHEIPANAPAPAAAPAPNNRNANAGVAAPVPAPGDGAAPVPPAAPGAAPAPQADAAPGGLQLPPLPPGMPALPPHLQAHLDALRLATAQAHQELNARGEGVGSSSSSSSSSSAAPLPASPLHPLFGSTPIPSQSSPAHPLLHYPSPHNHLQPPPHPSSFHSFLSPFHAAAAQHPQASPQPGAVMQPPTFMFPPPPPPPPPAHMFPLSPPSAGPTFHAPLSLSLPLSGVPGGLALPSADPLFGAYLSHHGMLLQHHIDFLTSSLNQARILVEQQRELERRFKEQQQQGQQQRQQTHSELRGDAQPSPQSSPHPSTTENAEAPVEDNKESTADSTLTQRRPRSQQP